MPRFPKIPSGPDLWSWPPVVVLLALAALFLATSAGRILLRERAIRQERRALAEQVRELESETARLEEAVRALGSPEAVERLAKETLNLKKPGEEVVVITPGALPATATAPRGSGVVRFLPGWLAQVLTFLLR